MRNLAFGLLVSGFLLTLLPAHAVENFIPQGHNYVNGTAKLPKLGSKQSQFDQQADIYQTEIYRKALERRKFDSHMRRFITNRNSSPSDFYRDY